MADSAAARPGEADIAQLRSLYAARRYAEAEATARQMIQAWPHHEAGWQVLAMVLGAAQRNAEALAVLDELRRRWPAEPETYVNLGNTLRALGRRAESVECYQHALRLSPRLGNVAFILAETLKDLGRLPEAGQAYRQVLAIDPRNYAALGNLGNILLGLGQPKEAEAAMRQAIAVRPDASPAYAALGNVLRDQSRLAEAAQACERALALDPSSHDAHNNLGNVYHDLARYEDAIKHYQAAIAQRPDLPHAYNNLGSALHALNRLAEAERSLRRAIELKPDYYEAHNNLARTLLIQAKPEEAAASCRLSLRLKPDYENAHSNLGNALLHLGELAEAAKCFRRALELRPDFHLANSILLFCLSHQEEMDAATLFAEHRAFGERFEGPLRATWRPHANDKDLERKLQVGFVSGDFRGHAVSFFIEPVLAALAGKPRLSLHAYSNHPLEDPATLRMRQLVPQWSRVDGLMDEELAEKIRADGIDILVDLSGHTGQNRLTMFARKPAPLQATWIGYPGTSGLGAMDYYLADRFFLPHRQFDAQFVEKIVHLPAYAAFQPLAGAPEVNALPARQNGYVTFGSFNRLTKISDAAVRLWAQVLLAVPDSRMLLAALPGAGTFGPLAARFAREGVAPERLAFYAHGEMRRYQELHHQVDLCLDTLAYTGGTTTLHALWMGVPTLTLAGALPPRRLGAVIANHAGLEEFVAKDAGDFIARGRHWAGNLAALAKIRAGLRGKFPNTPMGQPALVAAGLERAFRMMWRRWCAGQPPAPLRVR
jgi:protein O-GlcNAc transferase